MTYFINAHGPTLFSFFFELTWVNSNVSVSVGTCLWEFGKSCIPYNNWNSIHVGKAALFDFITLCIATSPLTFLLLLLPLQFSRNYKLLGLRNDQSCTYSSTGSPFWRTTVLSTRTMRSCPPTPRTRALLAFIGSFSFRDSRTVGHVFHNAEKL